MNGNLLFEKRERWFLLAILFVAAVLRLAWLGAPSYWLDEMFQVRAAAPTLAASLDRVPLNKPHLFYVIQYFVGRFSFNEWIFRMPACIAGILAIWAMWGLARTALDDRRAALFAAGLLAVSPLHIQYSQEARPYALALLFALCGVWAMLALMEKPGWLRFALAALLPALSGWTLYFGIGLAGLQVLWVTVLLLMCSRTLIPTDSEAQRQRGLERTLVALLVSMAILSPLLLRVPGDFRLKEYPFDAPSVTFELLIEICRWIAFEGEGKVSWFLAAGVWGLAVVGAVRGWRGKRALTIFLLCWLLVLQALQVGVFIIGDHWLSARYNSMYVIPLLLVASEGCTALLGRFETRRRSIAMSFGLIFLVMAVAAELSTADWREKKPNMRRAVQEIAQRAEPDDVALGSGHDTRIAYTFYAGQMGLDVPYMCDFRHLPEDIRLLKRADRIWLLYHYTAAKSDRALLLLLDPSLPEHPPVQPMVRPVDAPFPLAGGLTMLERLQPKLEKIRLELPALIRMGGEETAAFLDRSWTSPRENKGESFRWVTGDKGSAVFWIVGGKPDTLSVRVMPFSNPDFAFQELSVWWDDICIMEASRLKRWRFTTLTARIPESAASDDIHVLTFVCAHSALSAGLELPEQTRDHSVAVSSIEIRRTVGK